MGAVNQLSRTVNKYKDLFLKKSNTTKAEWDKSSEWPIFNGNNFPQINEGWFTHAIDRKNGIFYIGSLFHSGNNRDITDKAFVSLKELAKSEGCKTIVFNTARNGKIWERRFKGMKITGWRMEIKL